MQAQDNYTRKSLNITVYNNDLGVIKDNREIDLKKGLSELRITDVAEKIDPTTVHINLNGTVLEQNYQYDLVNMYKVLNKYIDSDIDLISDKNVINGKLLSVTGNQVVLKTKDGGLVMLPKIDDYRISVGTLPEGLITRPTLVWSVDAARSGKQDVELSYHTSGMKWTAEYVAVLNNDDTKMDLNAWVSVTNNSGATYKDAVLKLVAGDVNRVNEQQPKNFVARGSRELAISTPPQFEEKEFFEYHIYNLQRPTTIADNENKQISLFEAQDIKINKKFIYYSYGSNVDKGKANVVVEFENKKSNNLGMPMPKGKVRMNKIDGDNIEFIGEDMIDHTPKDEKVKLKVGEAFDIAIEDKQVDFKKITDKVSEYTFEIKIKNHKSEAVDVNVERYLGLNWEILNSNIKYDKLDAQKVNFVVPVKANDENTLRYKVRLSY
jgi:hypothetical protein